MHLGSCALAATQLGACDGRRRTLDGGSSWFASLLSRLHGFVVFGAKLLDEGVVGVDGRVDVGVCGSGGVEEVDWSICQSGDCHCKVEREHTFSFSEHCLHHLVASFIFVRLPVGFGLAPRVAVLVSPCFACWRLRLALVPSFPGLFRACSILHFRVGAETVQQLLGPDLLPQACPGLPPIGCCARYPLDCQC